LYRSRQERLRRLPPDLPRDAETLKTGALAILLALLAGLPQASSPAAAAAGDPAARGAHLAAAAGCGRCHTDAAHKGAPYAGGRALAAPYGTIVTPNITPDRQTGIGGWRLADFVKAMRWGIAPDDSHYLPAFPFTDYNRLSARDLDDLWAFLGTVPAAAQVNRAGQRTPFAAARAAVAVAASPFPGPWRPDPRKDAAWNRGDYLVATVGRCGDCHTARNWLGAPDTDHALAGVAAGGDGHAVPNITPDPQTGIGRWGIADIVTLLTDGQLPDFDFVGGAMSEIVDNTARLDDADRRAIAIYLKSLKPIRSRKKAVKD
ncbi:MAG: c-type cytochrome, partial [Stellaceae bacterium]